MKLNRIILVLIAIFLFSVNIFAAEKKIQIYLNDHLIQTSSEPIIDNGTTLVPMRSLFEAFGMDLKWDSITKTIMATGDSITIKLIIGSNKGYVNGEEKLLSVPAKSINGNTMIPLKFVSQALGYNVNWDGSKITIQTKDYVSNNVDESANHEKSDNQTISTTQLYVIDGTGKYSGYKILKGYTNEDRFRVYYKGTPESYSVFYDDLSNINLNEIITWNYEGKIVKSKRKDLYNLFSDTSQYSTHLGIYDTGLLSQDWFEKTFGQVYWDWAEGIGYANEAEKLVEQYFVQTGQSKIVDRTALRDIAISQLVPITEEWVDERYLYQEYIVFSYVGGLTPAFKRVSPLTGTVQQIIYEVPDFDYNLQGEKIFSGIKMKKENGKLYFYLNDLIEKGIISK